MEHIWTVICGKSSIDQETKNLSLFEIIEQLNIVGPPLPLGKPVVLPIQIEIVSLWSRSEDNEPSKEQARIKFEGPGISSKTIQTFDIDLTAYQRFRSRAKVMGIPIAGHGKYIFTVEYKNEGSTVWDVAAKLPIQINLTVGEPNKAVQSN